jgi:hypothetical protein
MSCLRSYGHVRESLGAAVAVVAKPGEQRETLTQDNESRSVRFYLNRQEQGATFTFASLHCLRDC